MCVRTSEFDEVPFPALATHCPLLGLYKTDKVPAYPFASVLISKNLILLDVVVLPKLSQPETVTSAVIVESFGKVILLLLPLKEAD